MQQLFKYDDMEDFKPPAKGGKDKYNRKIMLIIIAYMMRLEETKEKALQPALLSIIKLVPNLTEMLMDTASEIQQAIQQGQIPPQKFSVMSLQSIVTFSQNIS